MVKLLQAYGMVQSEGTELKRRKKVAMNDISQVNSLALEFTLPVPIVLHGAPTVLEVDIIQWKMCDHIMPIVMYH